MQSLSRTLPDKIVAMQGVARDLSAHAARLAEPVSRSLPGKFVAMRGATHDLTANTTHLAQREFDRARDLGEALQRRFERDLGRDRRSARYPLAVSAFVLGAAIGGALLASPRVREGLRRGWNSLRRPRPSQAVRRGDGADGPSVPAASASKPPHERQEDLLDEGLEESFPASDPVSVKRIT
jgi:hypothetical protein